MPLIDCPDCGTQVSDHAAACPKCARPLAVASKPLGAGAGCLMIVAGFLVIMAIAVASECGSSPKTAKPAAPSFCANWAKTSGDLALQRVAVLENVKQLDGSKVDKACLAAQTDSLVRWVNRTCGAGLTIEPETFAMMLVKEARSRCP